MKKIIFIFLTFLILFLSGCQKPHQDKNEIYGKYLYKNCLVYNSLGSSPKDENFINQDIARFSFKENSFAYFKDGKEANFILTNIEYRESSLKDNIDFTDPEFSYVKDVHTRYDIYKNDAFQGYSILFSKDYVYLLETINQKTEANKYKVYQIVIIELIK